MLPWLRSKRCPSRKNRSTSYGSTPFYHWLLGSRVVRPLPVSSKQAEFLYKYDAKATVRNFSYITRRFGSLIHVADLQTRQSNLVLNEGRWPGCLLKPQAIHTRRGRRTPHGPWITSTASRFESYGTLRSEQHDLSCPVSPSPLQRRRRTRIVYAADFLNRNLGDLTRLSCRQTSKSPTYSERQWTRVVHGTPRRTGHKLNRRQDKHCSV